MHHSEDKIIPSANEALRIVIIGGGIAGVSAAEASRKQNDQCSITILSSEHHLPYHRIRVADVLRDNQLAERMSLHPENWYEERRIELVLNVEVTAVDTSAKEITLATGAIIPYDKLIIATGSSSFIPPIAGSDHPNVHTLWSMNDALELAEKLDSGLNVAVIGGGLLGLETAWQIRNRGNEVTVVEFLPRLLARQLNEEGSRVFLDRIEQKNIRVITSAATQSIDTDPADPAKLRGITLQDGSFIEADLVVISAGVRANTQLAATAGLDIGMRIRVNDLMETSAPDVYGAGDAVELLDGSWYGLWMVAQQEGRAAGTNAAGGSAQVILKAPPYMLNTIDTRVCTAGIVQGPELDGMILEEEHNKEALTYKCKVFNSDHQLKGFILLGDIAEQNRLLQQISV